MFNRVLIHNVNKSWKQYAVYLKGRGKECLFMSLCRCMKNAEKISTYELQSHFSTNI